MHAATECAPDRRDLQAQSRSDPYMSRAHSQLRWRKCPTFCMMDRVRDGLVLPLMHSCRERRGAHHLTRRRCLRALQAAHLQQDADAPTYFFSFRVGIFVWLRLLFVFQDLSSYERGRCVVCLVGTNALEARDPAGCVPCVFDSAAPPPPLSWARVARSGNPPSFGSTQPLLSSEVGVALARQTVWRC